MNPDDTSTADDSLSDSGEEAEKDTTIESQEGDTSTEQEGDTSTEEPASEAEASSDPDESLTADDSLPEPGEEIMESTDSTTDESAENDAAAENSAEKNADANDGNSSSAEADDIYTLYLDDSWEYIDNPCVGGSATTDIIYCTRNGERMTDFSGYILTAFVDDESIAEAEISKGYSIGIEGEHYSLRVSGLAVGETTVTVQLQDENGTVLAAASTPVSVSRATEERTYYAAAIDNDNVIPGKSLPIKLTRVDVTSDAAISTDVSDKITDVIVNKQYAYDENNNYVESGLFSVSGSTAEGWYLNVLDYGTAYLMVYYSDNDTTNYINVAVTTGADNKGVWVTPEQSEYTVKVGESITIEFDAGIIVVMKDGYERKQSYQSFYTIDATESYNGSEAYEYCAIKCSDKKVTITGQKEGSADVTISLHTSGLSGNDNVADKQLKINVVAADSGTGTETTEPGTTETTSTETSTTETPATEATSTEKTTELETTTEPETTETALTETDTKETSAAEAASTANTKGTESESETEDSSVKTGDNSPIELYIAIMLLAMAIVVTGTFERRIHRN